MSGLFALHASSFVGINETTQIKIQSQQDAWFIISFEVTGTALPFCPLCRNKAIIINQSLSRSLTPDRTPLAEKPAPASFQDLVPVA